MWGNKSPTPPVFRPKGRGIKPKGLRPNKYEKVILPVEMEDEIPEQPGKRIAFPGGQA
jgi:hypothetical protein